MDTHGRLSSLISCPLVQIVKLDLLQGLELLVDHRRVKCLLAALLPQQVFLDALLARISRGVVRALANALGYLHLLYRRQLLLGHHRP